jgi:AmmeMemoRadiSam system protein B
MSEQNVRPAAVAGKFYSASPSSLMNQFNEWFQGELPALPRIHALIVPHAGYLFSGHTAAMAYRSVLHQAEHIERVLLLGPSHRFYFHGCALPQADYFESPLGRIHIDNAARSTLNNAEQVILSDAMHEEEHSLEVQVPFIQYTLSGVSLIPIVTSNILPDTLAKLIDPLWDASTLLVVSSDLSHFHSYDEARRRDAKTCDQIEQYDATIEPDQACGCTGINTLLLLARQRGYQLTRLEQINSGDRHADKERVVGYVSYAISETDTR